MMQASVVDLPTPLRLRIPSFSPAPTLKCMPAGECQCSRPQALSDKIAGRRCQCLAPPKPISGISFHSGPSATADHTPGQLQFRDEAKLHGYYRGEGAGKADTELDTLFERRFACQKAHAATNMCEIVALAHHWEIPLASHDDTADENVTEAIRNRVSVAKFPTTI
jgi:hypothetical protein